MSYLIRVIYIACSDWITTDTGIIGKSHYSRCTCEETYYKESRDVQQDSPEIAWHKKQDYGKFAYAKNSTYRP